MRYREVRSIPLKYVRNFIFDPFLRFFSFDSLGCVPENPCPDCRGVPIAERPNCRGSTVVSVPSLARRGLETACKDFFIFALASIAKIPT